MLYQLGYIIVSPILNSSTKSLKTKLLKCGVVGLRSTHLMILLKRNPAHRHQTINLNPQPPS